MASAYILSFAALPRASSQAFILSFGYCSVDLMLDASEYFDRAAAYSFNENLISPSLIASAYNFSLAASSQALILSFGYCSSDLMLDASKYFIRAVA